MTSKFRAQLRSRAQKLSPYVMVGQEGITEGVVKALSDALECHELVKVRFQAHKELVNPMSLEIETATGSELVAVTGFTSVFYLKKKD